MKRVNGTSPNKNTLFFSIFVRNYHLSLIGRCAAPILLLTALGGIVVLYFLSSLAGSSENSRAKESPCQLPAESAEHSAQSTKTYWKAGPIPGDFEYWFFNHTEGRIVWKWHHYFDIYEEIFRRFKQREHPITMLEIGTRDGGSLDMWKQYFGPSSKIIGLDINPHAQAFEDSRRNISMHIGSQNDRQVFVFPKLLC